MIFHLPEPDSATRLVLGRIDELKARLGAHLREPTRWTGLLRRNVFARAIQGSNTIEGYNITVDDAIAAVEGEEPIDADAKTWAEIVGYRQAMTYVLQLARDPHFRYSADQIKSLHYMLLSHELAKDPGHWRPGYVAVRDQRTQEVVYEGPDASLVPGLVGALVDSLNTTPHGHPILRAAMAHLNLVMIHPFRDGNGQMARCLQTLVLGSEGNVTPEFSSIEEYLGRNTRAYYDVLARVGQGNWHPENDATRWIAFCLTAHYRQAQTVLNRIDRMRRVFDAIEREVKAHGLPERTTLALADAVQGYRVRNPLYRRAADVTTNVASRDLRLLVSAGLLEPRGERKGRYYVAARPIEDIRKANETVHKMIPDPFEQLSLGF